MPLGARKSTLDQAKRFTGDQLSDSEGSIKPIPDPKPIRKESPGKNNFLNSVKEFLEDNNREKVVRNANPGGMGAGGMGAGVKDAAHNQYSHS